jgi:hypothetical protein
VCPPRSGYYEVKTAELRTADTGRTAVVRFSAAEQQFAIEWKTMYTVLIVLYDKRSGRYSVQHRDDFGDCFEQHSVDVSLRLTVSSE